MSALASGRPLRMEGQLLHPGPDCTGWFEFAVEDPVPLDEQLLASLPGTSQQVVRSLQPHGSLTVWGRYERRAANPSVLHKRLEIGLRDCSVNFERFPYPLYRIRGTLSMSDDHWVFRDLQGGNDSGWVVCNGTWAPAPQGGTELLLDFNAMDVPLEDELRNALKPEAQQVWNSLCPRGTIDQLRSGSALRLADPRSHGRCRRAQTAPRAECRGTQHHAEAQLASLPMGKRGRQRTAVWRQPGVEKRPRHARRHECRIQRTRRGRLLPGRGRCI